MNNNSVDNEWNNFMLSINNNQDKYNEIVPKELTKLQNNIQDNIQDNIKILIDEPILIQPIYVAPNISELHISTQTKIMYLNQEIELIPIFWEIPIILYYLPIEGIVKKQITIICYSKEEINNIQEKIDLKCNDLHYNILKYA